MPLNPLYAVLGAAVAVSTSCRQAVTPSVNPAAGPGADVTETVAEAATGELLFTGAFQPAEYEAAGSFTITRRADRTTLKLSDDFASNPGAPDLYVVIGDAANPIEGKAFPYPLAEDEYETVAVLKAVAGAQTYEIPAAIDLDSSGSVVIWCKRFNATMGYAPLVQPMAEQHDHHDHHDHDH